MVTPNATVAGRVREAMEAANVSQRALAEHAGIAGVTLTRRLMGRTSFTAEELIAIAMHLDVDPGRFFVDFAGAKS